MRDFSSSNPWTDAYVPKPLELVYLIAWGDQIPARVVGVSNRQRSENVTLEYEDHQGKIVRAAHYPSMIRPYRTYDRHRKLPPWCPARQRGTGARAAGAMAGQRAAR